MDNIKNIVQQVVGKMAGYRANNQGNLESIWVKSLDEKELKHTQLRGYKDGKIYVNVDSSAWMYQMNIKKNKLLNQLKKEMPEIRTIYFQIGKTK